VFKHETVLVSMKLSFSEQTLKLLQQIIADSN